MQLNERQMMHAGEAASSIQDFFEKYLNQLRGLAVNEHIIALDEQGKDLMKFYQLTHWEITTLCRVDERGEVIYVVPDSAGAIGADSAWGEHIHEVMQTKRPVIGDGVTTVLGSLTVVCYVPISDHGLYRGCLGISVPFDYLSRKFLARIKIGEEGYAWLIDKKGTVLYSPVSEYVGASVFETGRDYPSLLTVANEMIQGRSGTASYVSDRVRSGVVELQTKHAVFMPIPLASTFWSICVATPEREVFAGIEGFRNRWFLTMLVLLIFGTVGFYYLIRVLVFIREEREKKETGAALRASEARYRAIVEDQSELITRFSPDLKLKFVNEAYCRYFGESRDQLFGEGFRHHVPEEDQERLRVHLASLSASNPSAQIEHRVVRAGGEIRWMQWIDHGIFDEAGDLLEIQAVGRDVTNRKQAEEALHAAHRRLLDIIDFLPDPTFVIDREGKVIAWNRAIEEMTGVASEAILGKGDFEYALPFYGIRRPLLIDLVFLSNREIEEKYLPLRREGGVVIAETQIKSFRGKEVFLWGKASPIYDEEGRVVGAIESIRDITEAKRAEGALRESERRFREILENVELASIILDKEGHTVFCNDFLLRVTEWRREELIGAPFIDQFVAEEDRAEMRLVFEEMMKTGNTLTHFETDLLTRKGERRTIHWNNTVLRGSSGEIFGVTCIGEDNTQRRQLERQLLQAQKMEAIGTMAGGIAHDFNNILAAILGYTELSLLETSEENLVHGHLQQILQSTSRARDLVRQILAFSRQQFDLKAVPVDLKAALEETLKFLRATLPSTIEIRLELNVEHLTAQINPTQLHQILVNLATNAAHAMRQQGGVLTLSLDEVVLEAVTVIRHWELQRGAYAKISVADSGHGMDAATIERIFDPYFTTKGVGEGSGLGLSIVHGIVTRYHGAVQIESEPGKGARFDILIPQARGADAPRSQSGEPEGRPVKGGNERILIVDDEVLLVDSLARSLSVLGYEVVSRTNSEDALADFRQDPTRYDLVITDLTMPRLTGLDLVARMREIKPDVRVILCTGFSDSISEEKAGVLGVQGLLYKPCDRLNVAETVRAVLDERRK